MAKAGKHKAIEPEIIILKLFMNNPVWKNIAIGTLLLRMSFEVAGLFNSRKLKPGNGSLL